MIRRQLGLEALLGRPRSELPSMLLAAALVLMVVLVGQQGRKTK